MSQQTSAVMMMIGVVWKGIFVSFGVKPDEAKPG
jgi:hypothetical protein